jgi:mannose-6-phosphate isomerase
MTRPVLYPLRFEPIFKTNLWGGHRLPALLNRQLAASDPIGEAWVLSDVAGQASRISNGPLAGTTFHELLEDAPERLLGSTRLIDGRFPLLCKFIDAHQELSVQVHPSDEQAARTLSGGRGKTEAWVILDADPHTSRVYAGFQPGIAADGFRAALRAGAAPAALHSYTPQPGDCIFLEAGTVHAIGADILLFEVQQTSDITYRLYDWDRVDAKTGLPRDLHVENALAAANFARGPCNPVVPTSTEQGGVRRERLVNCSYFTIDRITSKRAFTVGAPGECRIIAVLKADARAEMESNHANGLSMGDVVLIPAEVGECSILPAGETIVLEIGAASI